MIKNNSAISVCYLFVLIFIAACGQGNPIEGGQSGDAPPILGLNTDGIGMDGETLAPDEWSASVAPDTAHVVSYDPPAGYENAVFEARCSSGSWIVDGEPVGYIYQTADRCLEWLAPAGTGHVQFVFIGPDTGDGDGPKIGIMINVSDEWYMNPRPPVPYEREVAFTNPQTGETVTAAEGELLVRLKDSESLTQIYSLRTAQDYQVLERLNGSDPLFRVRFDQSVDIVSAWADLAADPRVGIVEPNYIAYPVLVPDDPDYSKKHEFPKIDAELAWDMTTGDANVWVATIDTGADRDHPDLAANIIPGADFITGGDGLGGETPGDGVDNNHDGIVDQNVGHGSHVAGIIAAQAFNGVGACGIAPEVSILPLRVFPTNGDTGATFSSIIEAVNYAAAEENVKVISMSIGTTYQSSLLQAAIDSAWSAGKVIVAAAANSNTDDYFYPAAHNNVVAVAAINKSGDKASFSNYGTWVDVSEYGTGIYSTYFDDGYAYMSGTSMACPLVSGCCALVFSYYPEATNEQVVSAIVTFTDDVYELNPDYLGELGSGIVNPYLALSGFANNQPGEMSDGDSDGSFSDIGLEPGPSTTE